MSNFMWKANYKLYILVLINIFIVTGYFIYDIATKPKYGYVDLKIAFDQFQLKKDLESKYLVITKERKKVLDSLYVELEKFSYELNSSKDPQKEKIIAFNKQKEDFYSKSKQFEEDNNALTGKYDSEVINQLNQYVKDFGEVHNYTFIFGSNMDGSIMQAKEQNNVTEEIVAFINDRYNGKK